MAGWHQSVCGDRELGAKHWPQHGSGPGGSIALREGEQNALWENLRTHVATAARIARSALPTFLGTLLCLAVPASSPAQRPDENVTLTFWASPNADELAFSRSMAAEWNEAHPGVTVVVQPIPAAGTSEEVLLAAVVAHSTPDICANMLPSIMNRFVHAHAVLQLDAFADFDVVDRERSDAHTIALSRSDDGHYYQLPWKANPVMLAYNRDTFTALHLAPPRTYDAFMDVARRLTYASKKGGAVDHWAMNPGTSVIWFWRMFDFYPLYVAASEGHTLLGPGRSVADEPAARQALQFLATGFKRGYFPLAPPDPDLFVQGRTGMRFIGPWGITYLERAAVHRFHVGYVPVPVPASRGRDVYSFADEKNIAIFSTTRHPQEAWAFVKFMTSRAGDFRLLEMTSQIPLRRNLTHDPMYAAFFASHADVETFARQAEHVVPLDDSPHIVQLLDYLSRQYEASAMYGLISPRTAVDNVTTYLGSVDQL